jgi:hypothetical protein
VSTIANAGFIDNWCWVNMYAVLFSHAYLTMIANRGSNGTTLYGLFVLLIYPCVIPCLCFYGARRRSKAQEKGVFGRSTCGIPHGVTYINMVICSLVLAVSIPISVLMRSNDINCRVVDKWLWGVIKEANANAPRTRVAQEDQEDQEQQEQQRPTLQGPPVTQLVMLTLTCPADGGPGTTLVQQGPCGLFSVVVPAGIAPGGSFPVAVPVPVHAFMAAAPVPATVSAAAAME